MFAALPPSSSVTGRPLPASSRWIAFPTSVEPVNAILSTSALTRSAPVRPSPVTMLTTPAGSPACRTTSQKRSAVSGVVRYRLRDLGERLLGRRGDRRVALARARLDELAADEQSVALLEGDQI